MMQTHEYNYNFTEYQKALNFLQVGCDCDCSKKVPQQEFAQLRSDFQNLSKKEQDAFVMGQLFIMKDRETIATSPRLKKKLRTNQRFSYLFDHKIAVCFQTYLNMLGVSHTYIEKIRGYWQFEGLVPRVHGNKGRKPHWKTKINLDQKVKEVVKKFIENYAEEHGLPNPGKNNRANNTTIFLPTDLSYKTVHQEFLASRVEDDELKSLKYHTFYKLWHQLTPNIKFMNPRTDLCDTCHKFRNELHFCQDKVTKQTQKKNFFNT